jgi:Golgi nucleoside diphosphatase
VGTIVLSGLGVQVFWRDAVSPVLETPLDPSYRIEASGQTENNNSLSYVLIVDCGSQGSRMHVIRIEAGQKFEDTAVEQVKPGISSFVDRPESAYLSLIPLLEFAEAKIPHALVKETSIFVFATGGVRNLADSEAAKILQAISYGISSNHHFLFESSHIREISGQIEGIFEWVAVNYLHGRLPLSCDDSPAVETLGILEMGGASVQFVYQSDYVSNSKSLNSSSQFLLKLNRCTSYHLLSSSYLNLGSRSARSRYEEMLLETGFDSMKIYDPCMLLGEEKASSTAKAVFSGIGNFTHCQQMIEALGLVSNPKSCADYDINASFHCNPDMLMMIPKTISDQNSSLAIIAIQEFYFTALALHEMALEQGSSSAFQAQYDDEQVVLLGELYCSQHYSDVSERNQNVHDLSLLCFRAGWISAVLKRIQASGADRILFSRTVNGAKISWALGAAILETLQISPIVV